MNFPEYYILVIYFWCPLTYDLQINTIRYEINLNTKFFLFEYIRANAQHQLYVAPHLKQQCIVINLYNTHIVVQLTDNTFIIFIKFVFAKYYKFNKETFKMANDQNLKSNTLD